LFGVNSPIKNFTLVVFANVASVQVERMLYVIDLKYQNYIVTLLIKINGHDQLNKMQN